MLCAIVLVCLFLLVSTVAVVVAGTLQVKFTLCCKPMKGVSVSVPPKFKLRVVGTPIKTFTLATDRLATLRLCLVICGCLC